MTSGPRVSSERGTKNQDVQFRENRIELIGRKDHLHLLRGLAGEQVGCQDPHAQRSQDLGNLTAIATQADNAHSHPVKIPCRTAEELLCLLGMVKSRHAADQAQQHRQCLLGHLAGKQAGNSTDRDPGCHDRRNETVVQAGCR